MANTFTREQLEAMTDKKLKRMVFNKLGMTGLSKLPKAEVVDAVLAKYGTGSAVAQDAPAIIKTETPNPLNGVSFSANSTLTNPNGNEFNRTTTTVHVSCGASSGSFPVIGRSVREVGDFLREVLNVDRLSTGLVNGAEVNGDYVLKQGDNLEFLKPAGKKGC